MNKLQLLGIHGVDLRSVVSRRNGALQFERRCEQTGSFNAERLAFQMHVLDRLESFETVRFAENLELLDDRFADSRIVLRLVGQPMFFQERLELRGFGNDNGNQRGLQGVAVDKDLLNDRVLCERRFDLVWRDVLSLSKFENVLIERG